MADLTAETLTMSATDLPRCDRCGHAATETAIQDWLGGERELCPDCVDDLGLTWVSAGEVASDVS